MENMWGASSKLSRDIAATMSEETSMEQTTSIWIVDISNGSSIFVLGFHIVTLPYWKSSLVNKA